MNSDKLNSIIKNKSKGNRNLALAMVNTFSKRNTEFSINNFREIVEIMKNSNTLRRIYLSYQKKLEYTKKVDFDSPIETMNKIIRILEVELVLV